MNIEINKRVIEFIEAEGISINKLSKILGCPQSTLNSQLNSDGVIVSSSTIMLLLENYPNLSAEWLMRGVGTMYFSDAPSDENVMLSLVKQNKELIEIILKKL